MYDGGHGVIRVPRGVGVAEVIPFIFFEALRSLKGRPLRRLAFIVSLSWQIWAEIMLTWDNDGRIVGAEPVVRCNILTAGDECLRRYVGVSTLKVGNMNGLQEIPKRMFLDIRLVDFSGLCIPSAATSAGGETTSTVAWERSVEGHCGVV